jgi:hypothetical protein
MASAVRSVSCACAGPIETNDLFDLAGFLQTDCLFDRDFVERVHRHFHIRKLNARTVRLHADLHIVVDNPLDGDENFHVLLNLF